MKYIISAVAMFILIAASANAEEIIWHQPVNAPAYQDNLISDGNKALHPSDVRKLQRSLSDRGFYKGKIDGIWGVKTTQAVLDYQAVHELELTGAVTFEMLRDLGVTINEKSYK